MTDRDFLIVPKTPKPERSSEKPAPTANRDTIDLGRHDAANIPDTPNTPDTITAPPERMVVMTAPDAHKSIVFGAGAFCLLAMALVASQQDVISLVLGVLAIGFFGSVAYFAMMRSKSSEPALIIDDAGIVDNATFFKAGLVPWDVVDDAVIHTVRGQYMLGIHLKTGNDWERSLPTLAKFGMGANRVLGYAPINLPRAAIDSKLMPIQAAIRQRLGKPLSEDT